MRLKPDYVLRQVADAWVVLPLGHASVDFNGMIMLNESGVILWKALEQGADRNALAEALCAEYDVSREEARMDAEAFVNKLAKAGCLEMESL